MCFNLGRMPRNRVLIMQKISGIAEFYIALRKVFWKSRNLSKLKKHWPEPTPTYRTSTAVSPLTRNVPFVYLSQDHPRFSEQSVSASSD